MKGKCAKSEGHAGGDVRTASGTWLLCPTRWRHAQRPDTSEARLSVCFFLLLFYREEKKIPKIRTSAEWIVAQATCKILKLEIDKMDLRSLTRW